MQAALDLDRPDCVYAPDDAALVAEARAVLRRYMTHRPQITSFSTAKDYLRTAFAGERQEVFRVLYLDIKNKLIEDHLAGRGTVNHTPVYPRELIRRALEVGASAMILAHNHPSGDLTPSHADIEMTRKILDVAKPFEIAVHDHFIVAGDNVGSMRSAGLI
ncbi:MAG: DNA repair protein RadC [Oceanicaulis sp.]|uniref:JAB domain-containing protein n=1 Tax=Glycocaulis sp. TaxID=1969725 RepID=UPI0025C26F4E|nr:DNA repair protein RadC [Glycocaulis sp.]MCC5982676.1 DNA repair protein RadC [Oceanicaulis sp.]MCH8522390.1 DNA repair protein RadC [Glycocaulis sp.]